MPATVDQYNLMQVIEAAGIMSALIAPIVMGIVDYLTKLGVKGTGLLIASLLSGVVLSAGAQLAFLPMPSDFRSWFVLVIMALIPGLAASGAYNAAKQAAYKGSARASVSTFDELSADVKGSPPK